MPSDLKSKWDELSRRTDCFNWYWLSYGEKCYAFAVVTAFPLEDSGRQPPPGSRLEPHPEKERVWVGADGEEMLVDDWLANIEQQNGDAICSFIAAAFADCCKRFGSPLGPQCTGVSANWCPIHGDCTCKDPQGSKSDDDCPLHAPHSDHGENEYVA